MVSDRRTYLKLEPCPNRKCRKQIVHVYHHATVYSETKQDIIDIRAISYECPHCKQSRTLERDSRLAIPDSSIVLER